MDIWSSLPSTTTSDIALCDRTTAARYRFINSSGGSSAAVCHSQSLPASQPTCPTARPCRHRSDAGEVIVLNKCQMFQEAVEGDWRGPDCLWLSQPHQVLRTSTQTSCAGAPGNPAAQRSYRLRQAVLTVRGSPCCPRLISAPVSPDRTEPITHTAGALGRRFATRRPARRAAPQSKGKARRLRSALP